MDIKELGSLVFYKMENYHQITIDLVDDAESILTEDDLSLERVGALSYVVSILLEVFNPEFKDDIDIINKLKIELDTIIATNKYTC